MAHRDTLTENQLAALRWVADGCPEGMMSGYSHGSLLPRGLRGSAQPVS
jgi:hypothetical protein